MSVKSLYSDEIQKAWATVFACTWAWSLKDSRSFEEYKKENGNQHFHHDLVLDPKTTLADASLGKYPCDEFKCPSLREAASLIIANGTVLPFPEPPNIDNLNAEQLRQFFDQDGVMGILRHT